MEEKARNQLRKNNDSYSLGHNDDFSSGGNPLNKKPPTAIASRVDFRVIGGC